MKDYLMTGLLPPERFIIATSEAMEAEYGHRADEPATVLEMCYGEIFGWWGEPSVEVARANLVVGGAVAAQISYLS